MTVLFGLAWRVAADTAAYLFAYWLVPVWAWLATAALLALGRRVRPARWVGSGGGSRRLASAAALGLLRPYDRRGIRAGLERLRGEDALPVAAYLTSSHALTPYYLLLMGPLLGKDVLLSHLIGALFFVPAAAGLATLLGAPGGARAGGGAGAPEGAGAAARGGNPVAEPAGREGSDGGWLRPTGRELGRFLGYGAWGLALGSLIGAAGLAHPSLLLSGLPAGPAPTQAVHAALGALLAPATLVWPVANLFVGTYLWKVGLAHAGLVAFFYATTASPQRIRLYLDVWGRRRALRWTAALLGGAVVAGLATAFLYGLTDLGINYKLSPEQMWTF